MALEALEPALHTLQRAGGLPAVGVHKQRAHRVCKSELKFRRSALPGSVLALLLCWCTKCKHQVSSIRSRGKSNCTSAIVLHTGITRQSSDSVDRHIVCKGMAPQQPWNSRRCLPCLSLKTVRNSQLPCLEALTPRRATEVAGGAVLNHRDPA